MFERGAVSLKQRETVRQIFGIAKKNSVMALAKGFGDSAAVGGQPIVNRNQPTAPPVSDAFGLKQGVAHGRLDLAAMSGEEDYQSRLAASAIAG